MRAFLPEVDERLEELLWSAWRRDPDVVRGRQSSLSPELQLGITCVRRRAGDAITVDEQAAVAAALRAVGRNERDALTLRVARSVAPATLTQTRVDSGGLVTADEVVTSTFGEVLALFDA